LGTRRKRMFFRAAPSARSPRPPRRHRHARRLAPVRLGPPAAVGDKGAANSLLPRTGPSGTAIADRGPGGVVPAGRVPLQGDGPAARMAAPGPRSHAAAHRAAGETPGASATLVRPGGRPRASRFSRRRRRAGGRRGADGYSMKLDRFVTSWEPGGSSRRNRKRPLQLTRSPSGLGVSANLTAGNPTPVAR
jgi:hypothetical protein